MEFANPIPGINTSQNPNLEGYYHPGKSEKNFPKLQEWNEKWSEELGREISAGGWDPEKAPQPDDNNIVYKKC